jgi:putative transposase
MIVSDNGSELTSNAILGWCAENQIEWHYIAPGKPMQNGFVESFMYRRPRGRKCFDSDFLRRVRSCIRPIFAALT